MKRKYSHENVTLPEYLRPKTDVPFQLSTADFVPLEDTGYESPPGLYRLITTGRVKSPISIPKSPPVNLKLWSLEPRRSKVFEIVKQESQDVFTSCEDERFQNIQSPKPCCTPGSYYNYPSPSNKSVPVSDHVYQSPHWLKPVSMNPFSPIPLEHLTGLCVNDDTTNEIHESTLAPRTPSKETKRITDCMSTPPSYSERSVYPKAFPGSKDGSTAFSSSSDPYVIRNVLGNSTFPSHSRFNSDFQCLSILGTGSSAIVYKVLSRLDGCLYAVKMLKTPIKGEAIRSSTLREIHALSSLSNRSDIGSLYIVRYHQAWIEDSRVFFQTELCEISLRQKFQHIQENSSSVMNENWVCKVFYDISLALEFIHRQGIVHLDIKPENVFLKDDKYKLGDFGLASKAGGRAADEGDSRYLPMEMLSDDENIDLTKVRSL